MFPSIPYPITFELGDIRIRPFRLADEAALFGYLSEPRVTELTSYPIVTRELVKGIIERNLSRWVRGELSKWGIALSATDELIGTIGFNEYVGAHRWGELAYDLALPHWGRGFARSSVQAVLNWTFENNLLDRIQAYARFDNVRSWKLLEGFGFQREGCLRSYRLCRGTRHDFFLYGLLKSEWRTEGTN